MHSSFPLLPGGEGNFSYTPQQSEALRHNGSARVSTHKWAYFNISEVIFEATGFCVVSTLYIKLRYCIQQA